MAFRTARGADHVRLRAAPQALEKVVLVDPHHSSTGLQTVSDSRGRVPNPSVAGPLQAYVFRRFLTTGGLGFRTYCTLEPRNIEQLATRNSSPITYHSSLVTRFSPSVQPRRDS